MVDLGSIPGLGRSPGERKGSPLQFSGLENSMNCIVHGVTKSQIRLRDFKKSFCIQHLNSVLESNKKFKPQIRKKKKHLGSGNMCTNVVRHEMTVDILGTIGNSI